MTYQTLSRSGEHRKRHDNTFNLTYHLNVCFFNTGTQCGTTEIDLPSGTISSPQYPDPYPNNQNCVWIIRLPDTNAVVAVEFAVFETEAG